jgi:hypothetical protein
MDLTQLRRMVNEPSLDTYDDAALTAIVEAYPLDDAAGTSPSDTAWTPTYDLHRAAASIWDEKAAKEQDSYDFSQGIAGNATYKRSQLFTQAMRMARHFRAMAPMRSVELVVDRAAERSLKSKWGGYPALLVDPDPTHGGVFAGEFIENEGDF